MNKPAPSGSDREKNAEVPLREVHDHVLHFILDSMSDGVTIVDEQGRFVLRNAAAERIAGISPVHASPAEWSSQLGVCLPDGFTPLPADQSPLARALGDAPAEALDAVGDAIELLPE